MAGGARWFKIVFGDDAEPQTESPCDTCCGLGIMVITSAKDAKHPWRWVICIPCQGRGEHANNSKRWIAKPVANWHKAASLEELRFISIEIRRRAPAPSHATRSKEELVRIQRDRIERLALARDKLARQRFERRQQKAGG